MYHLIFGLNDLVRINRIWLHKEPKVSVLQANAKLVQRGECRTWNQRSNRGLGSIPIGGNILLLEFCFYIVKPLMPILALLPILGVLKKLWCFKSKLIVNTKVQMKKFRHITCKDLRHANSLVRNCCILASQICDIYKMSITN